MIQKSLILIVLCSFISVAAGSDNARQTIPLDGTWQVQATDDSKPPSTYSHEIPVPGCVALAKPPFERKVINMGFQHDLWVKGKYPNEKPYAAFWYRRTFKVAGPVPPVALLKINKSRWGLTAWLNGKKLGEHHLVRTPAYFDISAALKGGGAENELVIKLGGSLAKIPEGYLGGSTWSGKAPGLYDSVSLILSGTPRIVRVQAVPEFDRSSTRLVCTVKNDDDQKRSLKVKAQLDGRTVEKAIQLPAQEEAVVELSFNLPDFKPWTPDNPHLYDFAVEVLDTEKGVTTDRLTDRFGMREFRIDSTEGRAYLNDKPIVLTGPGVMNVLDAMEYPGIEERVWDEKWIRSVYRGIKAMNGVMARASFDLMPKIWYDIADEEGVMIQCEMTDGIGKKVTVENLINYFTSTIHEHVNHPSIVIWDASNETQPEKSHGRLLEAIKTVRHLDLSNRPWDNSREPTGVPGDLTYEKHVYEGWKGGRYGYPVLERMARPDYQAEKSDIKDEIPLGKLKPGYIINEHCGIFLRPNGDPSRFSKGFYEKWMANIDNFDDCKIVRARYTSMEIEILRRKPGCLGVMPNPMIHASYREYMEDMLAPQLEPHFARYVKDASAQVQPMIDFWNEYPKAGAQTTITVNVSNDSPGDWSGDVTLRLLRGERNLFKKGVMIKPPENSSKAIAERTIDRWQTPLNLKMAQRGDANLDLTLPTDPGLYQWVAEITGPDGDVVRSWRDFEIK